MILLLKVASFEISSELKNENDTVLANQIGTNFLDTGVSNKYRPNIYAKNLGTRYTLIDETTQDISYDDYFVFATLKLQYNYYENETVGDQTNYFVEKNWRDILYIQNIYFCASTKYSN